MHFGGARARVVVRGKRHPVRTGVQNCQQFALFYFRHFAIASKEITGLADWSYYVELFGFRRQLSGRRTGTIS